MDTPRKINMEPENTPLEKDGKGTSSSKPSFSGTMLIFRGVLDMFLEEMNQDFFTNLFQLPSSHSRREEIWKQHTF